LLDVEEKMKSTNKLLVGIVLGIILLVVIAFVITLARPEASYQAEDTPAGVAHNYLLAIQKKEYERAYTYLSPMIKHYPVSANKFASDVRNNSWAFRLNVDTSLMIEDTIETDGQATVQVRESRFYGGDLFDSNQSSTTFSMDLQLENGVWRIIHSQYYFAGCWENRTGCR